jgi:hypothetical protein
MENLKDFWQAEFRGNGRRVIQGATQFERQNDPITYRDRIAVDGTRELERFRPRIGGDQKGAEQVCDEEDAARHGIRHLIGMFSLQACSEVEQAPTTGSWPSAP